MEIEEIKINEESIKRLVRKILRKENENLKTKEKSDANMIKWIQHQIEEEVKCCYNR